MLRAALVLGTFVGHAEAEVAADEIKNLPGWDKPLPSKHYSGYLDAANGTKHMHYYLQLSEGDPKSDPVTLWMNGGPGCTSLKGGFEELGQLVFNRHSFVENTSAAPKMYYNPQGWTQKSTMLYFGEFFSGCCAFPCMFCACDVALLFILFSCVQRWTQENNIIGLLLHVLCL
eukprot:SAG31_NODE_4531_length_3158_cov_4.651193_5_plen_173_part_00